MSGRATQSLERGRSGSVDARRWFGFGWAAMHSFTMFDLALQWGVSCCIVWIYTATNGALVSRTLLARGGVAVGGARVSYSGSLSPLGFACGNDIVLSLLYSV